MALWISKLVNALCQPLVKRISAELRPHHEEQIAALRRSIEPPALPLILRNEIEHMQQLPMAFLQKHANLVFIGYGCMDLSGVFANSRCLTPSITDESSLSSDCLVFLDEYHLISLIRGLPTLFTPVRKAILFPFYGDYLADAAIRQILHFSGFPEIYLIDYERISDHCSISGISHPAPVSSLPLMICPEAPSISATRWLVASRYPSQQ